MAQYIRGEVTIGLTSAECWMLATEIMSNIDHKMEHYKQYPRTWTEDYASDKRRMMQMFFDLCDKHDYYESKMESWQNILAEATREDK